MATIDECEAAVQALIGSLAAKSDKAVGFDRTVSCAVSDLGEVFSARLSGGAVHDLTREIRPKANIRMTTGSDDLVALARGELKAAAAWTSGRLKVSASFADMLKLRTLL